MRILMSGSSGLIGSALIPALRESGHSVTRMVRREPGPSEVEWHPERGEIDLSSAPPVDAVIHLAGESVFGRWTAARKKRIRDSRIPATNLIAEAVSSCAKPPAVFLSASAIGYYGDRKGEELDEDSPP